MAVYSGTPKSWVSGEVLLASDFNAEIRDPIAALSSTWTPYTPTLTGFTLNNGTVVGNYIQVGKLVMFKAIVIFGSTTAAATAYPEITLPVTATAYTTGPATITGFFYDTSASTLYVAAAALGLTTTVRLGVPGTNGVRAQPTTSSPFTWTTGDQISVSGIYEAA